MSDVKTFVPEVLASQLNTFIDSLESYNENLPLERQRSTKDYEFLRKFYIKFLDGRNKRADDVESPVYAKTRDLANAQFPITTLWNLCMDGRVKTVLTNGATAGVGASIRVPGGILREFVRGRDGKLTLRENSNFAQLITQALRWSDTDCIAEVFDSHVACAARNAEELARGRVLEDSGLLNDILHKREMLQALGEYMIKRYGGAKHVIGIQTAFDPHDGFLYMGLETDDALAVAKDCALGQPLWKYTTDVLQKLASDKKIIYTKDLLSDKFIHTNFKKHAFSPNWIHEYVQSASQFWNNIASMREALLPIIIEKLLQIYPALSSHEMFHNIELEERAMLLLTNAFIGFLHNQQTYPYGVHREECIKVSRGGYPPYEISAFVVLGSDEKNLVGNIELSAALVRNNRREKRVTDWTGIYADPQLFVQAPVPLIIQEILEESLPKKEWESLSLIDWSDLPRAWDSMSDVDFLRYLKTKGEIHISVAMALNNLRHKMAILFDPDEITAGRLVSHHKVALPVMVDKNRINYFIVPFIKLGFD